MILLEKLKLVFGHIHAQNRKIDRKKDTVETVI